jgi:hypothetical protein
LTNIPQLKPKLLLVRTWLHDDFISCLPESCPISGQIRQRSNPRKSMWRNITQHMIRHTWLWLEWGHQILQPYRIVGKKSYGSFKEIAARSDLRAPRSFTKVPLNNETALSDMNTNMQAPWCIKNHLIGQWSKLWAVQPRAH